MLLYFAGPLFSKAEKQYNISLTHKIEKCGFNVFLPQRDGIESDKAIYETLSKQEIRQKIFHIDKQKIFECDIFFFLLDGRIPDEGGCVELGLAYAHKTLINNNKVLIGFQTDIRTSFLRNKLNPMVEVPFDRIILHDESLLLTALKKIKTDNPDK